MPPTYLHASLPRSPDEDTIRQWFNLYAGLMGFNFWLFLFSIVALVGTAFAALATSYSLAVVVTLSTLSIMFIMLTGFLTAHMYLGFTMRHLQATVSSVQSMKSNKVAPKTDEVV